VGEAAGEGELTTGAAVGNSVALGVGAGVSVGAGAVLSLGTGEAVSVAVGDAETGAVGAGVGLLFFLADFLRGFGVGVGVGLTKRCLILSTMVSFCAAPHSGALIVMISVSAVATNQRVAIIIPSLA
jgi:hypothetical protein